MVSSVLSETLGWTPDGLLATHTVVRPDFTDSRSYTYANLSRRLTQEIVGLNSTASWTNVFAYDNGVAGGPGVLTGNGQAAGTNVVWKGGTDAFSRVNVATNSVAQRQAYGLLNGTATMTALLDGNPMAVTTIGTNDVYEWRAQLALQPGAHQLIVNALNWSGLLYRVRNQHIYQPRRRPGAEQLCRQWRSDEPSLDKRPTARPTPPKVFPGRSNIAVFREQSKITAEVTGRLTESLGGVRVVKDTPRTANMRCSAPEWNACCKTCSRR